MSSDRPRYKTADKLKTSSAIKVLNGKPELYTNKCV